MINRRKNFEGVHSDLVKVAELAATYLPFDIVVIQGARTPEQHAANVASGATRTTRSRHVRANNKSGMACAVDMAPQLGKIIPWQRLDLFQKMNDAMMKASAKLGIPIEWGGAWRSFKDLNHWQLPWRNYT
jgi:peptidoglycan LD-endopeptidase CwlK